MSDGGCPTCRGFDPLDGRGPVCQCGRSWAERPRKRLTRRTPLSQGTKGLASSKGLSRSTPMPAGRAPMSRTPSAPKPRAPRVASDVRALVLARSRGRCEVGITDACRARGRRLDSPEGTNQHHRRPGGMGGSKRAAIHSAANLLQVCGQGNTSGCHGWIENNRWRAMARGWLLVARENPASVPVELWDGRFVLLDDTGGYVDAQRVPEPTL